MSRPVDASELGRARRQVKPWLRLATGPAAAGGGGCLVAGAAGGGWESRSDALRSRRCSGHSDVVELAETLDDVARALSRGGRLQEAIDRLDFPVSKASSV